MPCSNSLAHIQDYPIRIYMRARARGRGAARVQMMLALCLFAVGVAAEPVTFLVSPDTHFTSAGGVPDIEKVRLLLLNSIIPALVERLSQCTSDFELFSLLATTRGPAECTWCTRHESSARAAVSSCLAVERSCGEANPRSGDTR